MDRIGILILTVATALLIERVYWIWVKKCAGWALELARVVGPAQSTRIRRSTQVATCVGLALLGGCAVWLQSPGIGLAFLALSPTAVPLQAWFWRARFQADFLQTSMVGMHTLRAYLDAGLGLPTALFWLGQSSPTAFSRKLARCLEHYGEGFTLGRCLERFCRSSTVDPMGGLLGLIQAAYHQGLSILPLVDRLLPLLALEQQAFERSKHMRGSAVLQACFACGAPVVLLCVLGTFQPDVLLQFKTGTGMVAVAAALVLQLMGIVWIWRSCQFD